MLSFLASIDTAKALYVVAAIVFIAGAAVSVIQKGKFHWIAQGIIAIGLCLLAFGLWQSVTS